MKVCCPGCGKMYEVKAHAVVATHPLCDTTITLEPNGDLGFVYYPDRRSKPCRPPGPSMEGSTTDLRSTP